LNSYIYFILESAFQFCDFSTAEFKKEFQLESLESNNGIGISLPMGVPEI
jgi:aminoglycoside phosphotransferase family enzyme